MKHLGWVEEIDGRSVKIVTAHGFWGMPLWTMPPAAVLNHHSPEGIRSMTTPTPDHVPAVPEGYGRPSVNPYPPKTDPSQPAAPQQQPQYPIESQAPQLPHYAMQPPVSQQPQYSAQPPMPNPAYGYPQPKSKIAAGLLGIFLGGLGIHRFYLGYTTIGIIQLVLTLVVGIFTFGLVGLWGVIEGIMILAGASYFQRDAQGVPLRD